MKLTLLLLIVSLFQLKANDSYSQSTKLSLEMYGVTVNDVIREIEHLSDFKFLYNRDDLDLGRIVTVTVNRKRVSTILKNIFDGTDVDFEVHNKQIVLKKKLVKDAIDSSNVLDADALQLSVSGQVVDDTGEPLPGASIIEKGTTNGTQTDFDGNFSISVADENATLVISYIGFATQEVSIAGQTNITVTLVEDAAGLDEVVVVGYGSQSKRDLTGAVSTVSTDEITKIAAANSTALLQGRAAGVRVEANGGAPGDGVSVIIRGTGTFGNDQPLYVVDGNIVDEISYLNPNDIENISVLKDAAAAAIYGSRAANGVVLINTKNGRSGDISITFESKVGFQSPTSLLDFTNARQYADYHNQARDNDGDPRAVPNDTGFDPSIDTDWQDLSLNTALFQDYSFSASGGGEKGTFYISGQYLDQEGVVVDSGFKRYNVTANTSLSKGRFSMTQNLSISRSFTNRNTFYGRERGEIPTIPVFNEENEGGFAGIEPNLHGVARGINWYGRAILNDDQTTTDRIIGSVSPQFEIMDGLTFKLNLGLNYFVRNDFNFEPTFFLSTSQEAFNDVARLREEYTRGLGILIENTLNYKKTIADDHNIDVLVGFTRQTNETRSVGGLGTDFNFNDFRVLEAANDNTDVFGRLEESALLSYLGRLNYGYKNKYLLSATVRRDGSSRFGSDNRWSVFPSFSAGWTISEESFFPEDGIVNYLKFRGSYGELGSQNIANYQTASVLNINNFYNVGGQVLGGAIVRALANPNLVWETTKTTNIGLDAQLFDGKVSLGMEYYVKESEDILVNVPIPGHGGLGGQLINNAATIENKGFEVLASYRHIAENPDGFNFDVNVNFNTLKNEVTSLGDGVNPITSGFFTQQGFSATRTDVGRPVGSFFGHVVEGLYQTQAEIDADGRGGGDVQLGDINFLDLDNDGDIDDDDRMFLGDAIPDFEYGINFNASYKNFDLTLFLQGVVGNELWNAKRYHYILDGAGGPKLTDVLNAWTPGNTDTNIPRLTIRDRANNKRSSDFFIEDGSYLRLKNIQVGYTLPSSYIETLGLSRARFYLSGQNLLTLTDYTGYDPEIGRSNGGGPFGTGVDRRAYPQNKNVLLGVQLSF
ncbi:TonB-dependent receptor [Flagellimonas onchidii]|uniref:TonB-dependent receptor n=1 Tax=Flagellimonas onchidii TaxID=2562684 RepID=UPI00145620BA|nr:TonB-dependent receptor [Allomuricauda onchidii]